MSRADVRTRWQRFRAAGRVAALGLVLGVTLMVVPDSSVAPTEVSMVKVRRAQGVDVSPHVVWILAVGSDARAPDPMLRSRGDAIQLVGMNTRTGAASAIGIPRDSWVPIPGHGTNRVNSALVLGGPQLMARTVQGLVGIEPDYVMVTRFPFFENMVDDIGGITVRNPRRFWDPNLKKEGFPPGRVRLSGYDAMAFSRIRKSLPDGDFGRVANQQRTLRGIQAEVSAKADRPGFVERGVMTVLKHTETDARPAELFRIAQAVAQVDRRRITTCVVPGRVGTAGSASVVFPDTGTARRWGNDARRDATIKRC